MSVSKHILILFFIFVGCSFQQTNSDEFYNILVIEGNAFRNVIPATVIDQMEQMAATYSLHKQYIQKGDKISMSNLFNMIASTSTGSVLTAALVKPQTEDSTLLNDQNLKQNKYFASDVLDWYNPNSENHIFEPLRLSFQQWCRIFLQLLMYLACVGIYYLIVHLSINKRNERCNKTKEIIQRTKDAFQNQSKENYEQLDKDLKTLKLYEKLKDYRTKQDNASIQKAITYLQIEEYKIEKKFPHKIVIIALIIAGFIGAIIYAITWSYKLVNNDRNYFDNKLDQFLGATNIKNALTDEIMIISYSFNVEEPRFFSKHSALTEPEVYDVSLSTAAKAGSSSLRYFKPYNHTNTNYNYAKPELLIDGGTLTHDPSLYAFLLASKEYQKKNIRLIVLGSGQDNIHKFDNKYGPVFLGNEFYNLVHYASGNSDAFISKGLVTPDNYYYFNVQTGKDSDLLYPDSTSKDFKYYQKLGNDLVNLNKAELLKIVQLLCDQKFN